MDIPRMCPGERTIAFPLVMRLLFSALCLGAFPADARAESAAPPPSRWLLDYGLTYAGALQQPTEADAQFTLIWLEAAGRVSPELDEAFLWQFDLLTRLARHEDALKALTAYCRVNPKDVSAALSRVDLIVEQAQTTEQRIAACESLLAEPLTSVEVAGDLHRRIAALQFAQSDKSRALERVNRALAVYPHNLAAHALQARIEGREEDPAVAVDLLLGELAIRPTSADVMRRLAEMLARHGLGDDAIEWFNLAVDTCRRNQAECEPQSIARDLARAYLDTGRFEECMAQCNAILADHSDEFEAQVLLVEAARRLNRSEAADRLIEQMSARFAELESTAIDTRGARTCAWIAWFHIDVQPAPERALRFARLADEFAPPTPQLQRVLGWALLGMDKYEEAIATLEPLADSDPWAAVGLARALQRSGNPDAAADAIRTAHQLRPIGVVRYRVLETAEKLDLKLAPQSTDAAVADAIKGFDRRVLDIARNPAESLEFTVTMSTNAIQVADSVGATISLTNRGPVTLSLGEGRLIDPQVAVSVRDTALKGERLDAYMFIPLHGTFALEPGARLEVTRALDVGPARRLLRRQPQRRFDLQFSFVLSPRFESADGVVSSLSGMSPARSQITRLAVDASDRGIERIDRLLQSGSERDRMLMVVTVLALLEERRDSLTQRATYPAIRIDEERVRGILFRALPDPVPLVRARALFGYLRLSPTAEMIAAAAPLVSDENWLCRLVAVEVLSRVQRAKFLPVLTDLAGDRHPLVSRLAEFHRERINASRKPARRR